jgi:natural product biosynthesis luciferase-like monooxygenase protein
MYKQEPRAIFVGEKGILISCAEAWLDSNKSITAVVSDSAQIREWCNGKDILCFGWDERTEELVANSHYDYLFSLANLRILSTAFIDAATTAAINFHDGPLPAYKGVNTPTWAILNGEQSHAITFHRMTASVDNGECLLQKSFPITDQTTSLTANAACFELALEGFKELIGRISSGTLKDATISIDALVKNKPDVGTRWYRKQDRPPSYGLLDWSQSAEEIHRLIRALDFGNYENPLCKAKLWNGKAMLYPGASSLDQPDQSKHRPGTVLSVNNGTISVACGRGVLILSDFADSTGEIISEDQLVDYINVPSGVLPLLPVFSEVDRRELDNAADNERFWISERLRLEPTHLPYLNNDKSIDSESYSVFRVNVSGDQPKLRAMAVSIFYIARICGLSHLQFGFSPASGDTIFSHLVTPVLPIRLELKPDDTIEKICNKVERAIDRVSNHGTHFADLELRHYGSRLTFPITFGLDQPLEHNSRSYPSDLHVSILDDGRSVEWAIRNNLCDTQTLSSMQNQLTRLLDQRSIYGSAISEINILTEAELSNLNDRWNDTATSYAPIPIHQAFENCVETHLSDTALVFESQSVTYLELNNRANSIAADLMTAGLTSKHTVGILMERSIDMVAALLAVLKCGCAYVPLDPTYPADRLEYMIQDANLCMVLCDSDFDSSLSTGSVPLHKIVAGSLSNGGDSENPAVDVSTNDLAYVIYTSGCTGKPKGVMVEHRNVMNFFAAMDEKVKAPYKTWLAVTSISFDISVLEIFWTLCRGFKVVLYAHEKPQKSAVAVSTQFPKKSMDLGLFYWNVAKEDSVHRSDKYRLLMEGARYADTHGFTSVWNPERHFAAFGGSFPNPAVTCAAIASITDNIQIRAGSCVAPLHSPIRIAEDWSIVDNLSNGRVGIAFASGWAPTDFVIQPQNFKDAKQIMFTHLETVRQLWKGETLEFDGPNGKVPVRTLPRPIQADLPVWITTAGNADSYRSAGELGANVLTHLLGQSLEDVAEKAAVYREARKNSGHKGEGKITLMLHTFLGESRDKVRAIVREPMKEYLRSAMFLVKLAAWNFPTFKKVSAESGATIDNYFENIAEEELDALLDFAFERYFETSGLFGTVADAVKMIDKCKSHGVDEVACLIDFGVEDQLVLDHLPYLNELRQRACIVDESRIDEDYSIANLIRQHSVTHMQCTPSMANLLLADNECKHALTKLDQLVVGGEALSEQLAAELVDTVEGTVTNMYGPTETTIWSTAAEVVGGANRVTIGRPLANTCAYITDKEARLLPPGVPGELVIGGDGVTRGYLGRDELTSERFIHDPYASNAEARMYKTGDLAMFSHDGELIYLGRLDQQVKINGYRIELGEIESALERHDVVSRAVVTIIEGAESSNRRIAAYVVPRRPSDVVDTDLLRENLKRSLPEFMIPTVIVQLESIPLTPNGKLDRKSLPTQAANEIRPSRKIEPANDIETIIANCWKTSLGVEEVGRFDNFFDIGGNSILLLDVLARLNNEASIVKRLGVTDVFRYSTVESLSNYVSQQDLDTKANLQVGPKSRASSRKAALNRKRQRRLSV